jgi:hypothetical protein
VSGWRYGIAVVSATGALYALAAIALRHWFALLPLALSAAAICAAALFERGRYRPRVSSAAAWRPTGERFIDPTTGTPTEVLYDPNTGAREYRSR